MCFPYVIEPLYVHRQSCYLFGRERRVADIPTDHPSCSKQHAVLQYRYNIISSTSSASRFDSLFDFNFFGYLLYRQVEKDNPDGTSSKQVRCDYSGQFFGTSF